MPRSATGSATFLRDTWFAKVTVAPGERRAFRTTARSEREAQARTTLVAAAAARLRTAGVDAGRRDEILTQLAAAPAADVLELEGLVTELVASALPRAAPAVRTFADVALAWTSGDLHRDFPGHVKKVDHKNNVRRLNKHILPELGPIAVTAFELEHAERALRRASVPAGSRRHVAQLIGRVLALAVYPMRLIKTSPIPKGWLPKPNARKASSYLYPDEEAAILECRTIALPTRLLFGFLAREGMRKSEAAALEWTEVDLERGIVQLDENKTDDPRAWKLGSDVARVLAWWKKRAPEGAFVFGGATAPNVGHLSDQLRGALTAAGVAREALFAATSSRMRLRAHDLRATFVTLALATGQTETWVQDRTGHTTTTMLARYRRAARTASEAGIGWLKPMDKVLPEVAESPAIASNGGGASGAPERRSQKQGVRREGLEPSSLAAQEPKPGAAVANDTDPARFRRSPPLPGVAEVAFGDPAGDSLAIQRRRRSRLGRAFDDALRAALAQDEVGTRRAVRRIARLDPRAPGRLELGAVDSVAGGAR